ncbi:MAG TPA: SRPBCC domain-containing protein, partial [bacterium]|nr:SRPBCC domain-containing protein [bacterium]
VTLKEFFPHPIETVWRAFTDPAALATWLMLNDFEPRVGHRFTLRSEAVPGWRGWIECEVLELDPHSAWSGSGEEATTERPPGWSSSSAGREPERGSV